MEPEINLPGSYNGAFYLVAVSTSRPQDTMDLVAWARLTRAC